MFVRVKKIGPYEYLYLVENVREGGRHVQRVIKAFGRRDAVENSDLLDGLIASAARHSRRSIVLSSFYRGELAELRRCSIGPDLVFGRLWAETGCRDVLRRHLADRRFGFDVERAIYLTVLHRLMVSGSDRHASTWQNNVYIPGADSLTLDHAYKAMAWLGEDIGATGSRARCRTEVIEEALYLHRKSLFGEISVAFFDTTSLYFEGRGGATLGQRGYSKDFRHNCIKSCWASCWTRPTDRSPRSSGPATPLMSPPFSRWSSACAAASVSEAPVWSPTAA